MRGVRMNSHHGNNNEQWQNFCNDTVLYYATRNILYKDKIPIVKCYNLFYSYLIIKLIMLKFS